MRFISLVFLISSSYTKVVDIRYMFNVNQPSEWDEDLIRDELSSLNDYGIYPIESFKGDDLNLKITLETGEALWIP